MNTTLAVFAAIFVVGIASSATAAANGEEAKQQLGRDDGFGALQSDRVQLAVARKVASCMVEKKPVVVVNYLNASKKTLEILDKNYRYFVSKCLYDVQQEIGSETLTLRLTGFVNYSLLAEAYLQKNGAPKYAPMALSEVVDSDWYRDSSAEFRLASCLAYTKPAISEKLVLAAVDSDDEKQAFSALSPFVSSCVPQGATMKIAKDWLRLRLALAIYYYETPKTPRSDTSNGPR